jgi:RHS repeat-associated protein
MTVWLNDLPIATIRPNGTGISVYFIHADELGTPRVVTDTTQKPVWRWDGDAFGRGLPNQDPLKTGVKFVYHLRYLGQYYDTESGLHYNYFRDYDPESGRYIQSDPIGLAGGFNTYAYVGGNPVSFVDLYGLTPSGAIIGAILGEEIGGVLGGTGDFIDNYGDMRDANTIGGDKYFHCKANCEAAQRGQGGQGAAQCISDSREWFDQHWPKNDTPSASAADQVANQHGRTQGAANPSGTCEQICAPFRPKGLPSQY